MSTEIHIAEKIYTALQQTFEEVREPGKSALVIPLTTYAQDMGTSTDTLRKILIRLHCEHRIAARKLDYPGNYPEAWEVAFIETDLQESSVKVDTFQTVTEHMNTAYQAIKDARRAVQQAILTMTDTEGVNFDFVKDIKHTLSQVSERFYLWNNTTYTVVQSEDIKEEQATKKNQDREKYRQFLEDTVDDAEYNDYLDLRL